MNQASENQTPQAASPSPQTTPARSWEAQLQERAGQLLAQRIGPLKEEFDRLQASFNEISARLLQQTEAQPTEEEHSSLLGVVKEWFTDSESKAEADFQARLEQARAEAESGVQARIEQARQEWQESTDEAREVEFQKRLETACAEAAGVARRESESQIEDLREQLEASRKALTLAVSSSQNSNFDLLRSAAAEIDAQRSQSDTLGALVRRSTQFAPRVVFFVVKGGDCVGWKASGFENGLNDETVKLLTMPARKANLLNDALTNLTTAIGVSSSPGENSAVLGLYGSPAPERAIAIPLVIRGKAAAVLYADSGTQSENAINTAAIETLMQIAGMGIELLPSRRGVEPARPAAAAPATPSIPSGVIPAAAPPPEPAQPEEAATPEPEAAEVEAPATEAVAQSVAPAAEQLEGAESQAVEPQETEAEPVAEAAEAAPQIDEVTEEIQPVTEEASVDTAEMPVVAPPPPPVAPTMADVRQFSPSAPTVPIGTGFQPDEFAPPEPIQAPPPYTPAPEPQRVTQPVNSVPTPASETEQRAHNDARRFARLLVSEIKLYNAAKVNDGRRNYDLYDRLKDEIDRSRKVYDKRVSPAVAARFDYFYDELVQTLAEGDPSKLGNNCPGPVVLASN
ncbi:MAG: hypothetical protein SF339_01640 [Blastocatellia bacterium]|nr:hypothetical protein [Blastocatellia bacterium]